MRFSAATLFTLLSVASTTLAAPLLSASAHARLPSAANLALSLDAPAKIVARAPSPAPFVMPTTFVASPEPPAPAPLVKRASKKTSKKVTTKKSSSKKPASTMRRYSASIVALAAKLSENATAKPLAKAAAKKVKHAARQLLTPLSLANQSQQGIRRKRAEFAPSIHQRAEVVIEDIMRF